LYSKEINQIQQLHMKKILLLVSTFFFLFFQSSFAQSKKIKGVITDVNNTPLSGTAIAVKGTTNGTATDSQGAFSLTVPGDAILVISHVGYTTKEVSADGRTFISETLTSKESQLENVVVIGYQTASKKSVTTAISSISAKEIKSYSTGNVANAIQGKMPGVQVFSGAGTPGSQPTIVIRGLSSLTGNTTPLVIVDGNEIGYNSLNFINPNDIETVDVLKDASASAIYGSRAGQGVILITTKRGKGKPRINFEASTGIDQVPKVKLADASEYVRIMNQIAANSGAAPYFPNPSNVTNNDYWNSTFDNGLRQNYNLSITGGKEGLSLYGSIGYYDQDSYYATKNGGNWSKITARFNADMTISKVFKIGLNISPSYQKWLNTQSMYKTAYTMDPTTEPFKSEDSVLKSIPAGYMNMTAFNPYYSMPNRSPFSGTINPDFYFRTNFGNNEAMGAEYGAYFQITPIKDLVIKTAFEGFANASSSTDYNPKYYLASNSNNKEDNEYEATSQNRRWKLTNTVNYKKQIGKHNIDILVGQSADDYTNKGTSLTKKGIPYDLEAYRYVSAAPTLVSASGYYQPGAASFGKMISYFGSLRYNYKEKYYVAGTMRADASSLVNPLYRWGYFPTVSAAWIISEEPFFQTLKNKIDFLKIRTSWGRAGGNLPGSVGAYLSTVGPTTYPDANGNPVTGYIPSNIANPEIKWEIQEDYTIGLDVTAFQNKLNLTVETYMRKPQNLLVNVNVDPVLGYPQGYIPVQPTNVGKLTTKGIDLSVGYKDNITSKLNFGANLTLSHFKSITDYAGNADPVRYGLNNDVITTFRSRLTAGHEPGAWYGYKVDGVFQTDAEAAAYESKNGEALQPLAKAGDLKFRDVNNDGVIDNKDLTDLGSAWPKLTGGLTLTLGYGHFDFRAELYGSYGQKYNNGYDLLMNGTGHYNFMAGLGDKFWHGEGTSNTFPILKSTDPNGNFSKMSSFMIEDASFTRLRLLQVGYTLPNNFIKGINNFRIYISAQNLFTLTKYSGLNPELPFQGIGLNGIDDFQAPQPKSYLAGISVSF
jgi:TonB-dependent starch-binding outer membrane protein SusC